MSGGALAGLGIVAFETRRAEELATMFSRHGARVLRAPALRETPLAPAPEAHDLARRLTTGQVDVVVLLTGVGTRALVRAAPELAGLLAGVRLIARGPKPLAALRELGVSGACPVPDPFTSREVLAVVDGLGLPPGARVAVQEYGIPPARLLEGLAARGLATFRVPVYRWELPEDTGPLRDGIAALLRGDAAIAVFTSAVQVVHLFRIAPDPDALRAALARIVVASIGPTCTESLEAHGAPPDLEASPPKLGPLVATIATRAPELLAAKR